MNQPDPNRPVPQTEQHRARVESLMNPPDPPVQKVSIVDVDVPFGKLVILMFKLTLASIPATFTIAFVSACFVGFVRGFFGALFGG